MQANFDGSLVLTNWAPTGLSPISYKPHRAKCRPRRSCGARARQAANSSGAVTADVHIRGTYGDPLGTASLGVARGAAFGQPFDSLSANVDLTDQTVALKRFEASIAGGNIALSGVYHHPQIDSRPDVPRFLCVPVESIFLGLLDLQQEDADIKGSVTLSVDAAGDLSNRSGQSHFQIANLTGQLSAHGLSVRDQNAGSLTANVSTSAGSVIYGLRSNFAGSDINVDGRTTLTSDYRSNTHATIRNLPVQNALALAGEASLPVSGLLTADGVFTGDINSPQIALNIELTKAFIYQEP